YIKSSWYMLLCAPIYMSILADQMVAEVV
ncbi:hypothetical protein A2U01_0095615, partial [Trifolium medium]|nr:hypothetical protein [Trifolium medium]